MNTLTLNNDPLAIDVEVSDLMLRVSLEDGRELSVPVEWFPRLPAATSEQRANWRLIGRGEGIHWPDIDADISIVGLLAGNGDVVRRPRSVAKKRWMSAARPLMRPGGFSVEAEIVGVA